MIVTRLPRTPHPHKSGVMKDATDENAGGRNDTDNCRLVLPGDAVEFGWFSVKLLLSKML